MGDWIDILLDELGVAAAIDSVSHPEAGGIDVFIGVTRSEKRADGVELLALDYEAYNEMAVEQMNKLLDQAKAKWPICRAAILHRVGRVVIGQASVVIAVSCPHRGQAFEACRFLIDELKKSVTIWKKEVWADESATWVDPKTK
jgi:molybdopterin synthase catalytic subunit